MRNISGVVAVCAIVCSVSVAEASFTINGSFSGNAHYFSGTRDFLRSSAAVDVDRVEGSISMTSASQPSSAYLSGATTYVQNYGATFAYSLSLYDLAGQLLLKYGDSGANGNLTVYNQTETRTVSSNLSFNTPATGSIGANYLPAFFKMGLTGSGVPTGFTLGFTNRSDYGQIYVEMAQNSSPLTISPAITYTEPPPATVPLPAAAVLFVPGLAICAALRRRG